MDVIHIVILGFFSSLLLPSRQNDTCGWVLVNERMLLLSILGIRGELGNGMDLTGLIH